MIWFTSDFHLGHYNIIKHCNRPFSFVDEMDNVIINNVNKLVKKDDILYFLGDFCWYNRRKGDNAELVVRSYRNKINCSNIILICGNHDYAATRSIFPIRYNLKEIKVDGISITLCHYALKVWHKRHYGSWHLYGHSHGTMKDEDYNKFSLSMDVGIDANNFYPINFSDVKKYMRRKSNED